jgi:hypothetical protein
VPLETDTGARPRLAFGAFGRKLICRNTSSSEVPRIGDRTFFQK